MPTIKKLYTSSGVAITAPTDLAIEGATGLQSSPIDANNYSLTASVAANALTIALKSGAGTDCTGLDYASFGFRSATLTSGIYSIVTVTSALSMTVSSGSTLGALSAKPHYHYIYILNNSGSLELAISSARYDSGTVVSTTAEGGAGAADSATAIYSTTARTNKPIRLIGRILSTQTTAGTWAAAVTEITSSPDIEPLPSSTILKSELSNATSISIDAGTNSSFGRWKRVDNLVFITVRWNTISISTTVSLFSFELPSSIPAPISSVMSMCAVYDNSGSVVTTSTMDLNTSRLMTITKPSGTFTGGVNTSYLFGQIVYSVD